MFVRESYQGSYFGDTAAPSVASTAACNDCVTQKQAAYTACRNVPPSDVTLRQGCFNSADAALQKCLQACGAGRGGFVAAVALALGLLAASRLV